MPSSWLCTCDTRIYNELKCHEQVHISNFLQDFLFRCRVLDRARIKLLSYYMQTMNLKLISSLSVLHTDGKSICYLRFLIYGKQEKLRAIKIKFASNYILKVVVLAGYKNLFNETLRREVYSSLSVLDTVRPCVLAAYEILFKACRILIHYDLMLLC